MPELLALLAGSLGCPALVVGDQGTLAWKGPRYLGFAREVLR